MKNKEKEEELRAFAKKAMVDAGLKKDMENSNNNRDMEETVMLENENENEQGQENVDNNIETEKQEQENNSNNLETEKQEQENNDNNVDAKKQEVEDYEVKSREYLDRLQRTVAEFDNFRKRTIKEKSVMYENGSKEVLEKMLPVIDNFERAIGHMSTEEEATSLAQGVVMIYKQLMSVLSDVGVDEIPAVGQEFDTNIHHAVAHEDNPEYGENEVQEVLQKGYMFKDRVLRHSMVKVVN